MTDPGPRPPAPYGDFQLEIYLAGAGISFTTEMVSLRDADLEGSARTFRGRIGPGSGAPTVRDNLTPSMTRRATAAVSG